MLSNHPNSLEVGLSPIFLERVIVHNMLTENESSNSAIIALWRR